MELVICLKGAKAICAAVGENRKDIVRLVTSEGLPAWRTRGTGQWMALPEDLRQWVRVQRDKYKMVQPSVLRGRASNLAKARNSAGE